MKYLKEEAHYNDLYDRITVEECRQFQDTHSGVIFDVALEFKKGEYYANKSTTIRDWMSRDRAKDERLASTNEPAGKSCGECRGEIPIESKDLMEDENGRERVLFIMTCLRCRKPHAFWESGEEWKRRSYPCAKCSSAMASDHKRTGNVVTTTYTCPSCGYKESDTLDLDEKTPDVVDSNFEEDRKKYCLSDKGGMEYITGKENLKRATDLMKDREENADAYDAVKNIKKLSIADLELLLGPLVEDAGYKKFELGKQDTTKGFTIGFTLQDNKSGRDEHASFQVLQKLLKKTLTETNWRLMSDGLNYRLGFLSGRLRGYEGSEALLELAKKEHK